MDSTETYFRNDDDNDAAGISDETHAKGKREPHKR